MSACQLPLLYAMSAQTPKPGVLASEQVQLLDCEGATRATCPPQIVTNVINARSQKKATGVKVPAFVGSSERSVPIVQHERRQVRLVLGNVQAKCVEHNMPCFGKAKAAVI